MSELSVGHAIIAGFPGTEPPSEVLQAIRTGRIGGVVLSGPNVESPEQVRQLTAALQAAAQRGGQPPLVIATDHEGGNVQRLRTGVTRLPSQMAVAARGDVNLARTLYARHAAELQAMGVTMTFAPVLDVNNNPRNPVIATRAFGDDVDRVTTFGVEAVRAWMESGIAPCGKHFPGHGDTHQDSHLTLPTVAHDGERLNAIELAPFRAAIAAGLPAVMTAHVVYPALDASGLPATLSPAILTELLKGRMDFGGAVITDSLGMEAIRGTVGTMAGARAAFVAGADFCLFPAVPGYLDEAWNTLEAARRTGEISTARLRDAYRRQAVVRQLTREPGPLLPADAALSARVYRQAVLISGRRERLPLTGAVKVLHFGPRQETGAEDSASRIAPLMAALAAYGLEASAERTDESMVEDERTWAQAGPHRSLLLVLDHAHSHPEQVRVLHGLEATGPLSVAALSNPRDLDLIGSGSVGITVSDPTASAQEWLAWGFTTDAPPQ